MKEVRYSKQATKKLRKMPKATAKKIMEAVRLFAGGNVQTLDIKAMTGSEFTRLRVGDWRVIIHDNGAVLLVVKVGARGDVYK